eukprot:COSAG02_NODE_6691_length_3419_cov_1.999699_5_plen_155_part_00
MGIEVRVYRISRGRTVAYKLTEGPRSVVGEGGAGAARPKNERSRYGALNRHSGAIERRWQVLGGRRAVWGCRAMVVCRCGRLEGPHAVLPRTAVLVRLGRATSPTDRQLSPYITRSPAQDTTTLMSAGVDAIAFVSCRPAHASACLRDAVPAPA